MDLCASERALRGNRSLGRPQRIAARGAARRPALEDLPQGNAAFTASAGEHSVGGTYTFDSETHAITFRFTRGETELGSITSRAYLSGNELTIVFPVTRLVEMARELGNNIESLSTAAALLAQYENAYIGFAFSK